MSDKITQPNNALIEKRFLKFKEDSKQKFNDAFDFSDSIYVNAKTQLEIRCKQHDFIFPQTPDKHLQSTHACPKCLVENKKPIINRKEKKCKPFEYHLNSLQEKYNTDFTYISGKGVETIVSFECNEHGYQEACISNLLARDKRYSCTKCSAINRKKNKIHSVEKVLNQIQTIHPNLIFKIDENYVDKRSWIVVECNKHGEFNKKVQKLITGQGCNKCVIDRLINEGILIGGYSEKLFKDMPELKKEEGFLYWMKVGEYYKVGITRVSAASRANSLRHKCGLYVEILHEFKMNLYTAFKIEQLLLKEYSAYRVYTDCSTELFSKNITNNFLEKLNE